MSAGRTADEGPVEEIVVLLNLDKTLTATKAMALRDAVYNKCDGIDGLLDGVIDDPRNCNFDPMTDLTPCPGDVNADTCFTSAQQLALKEIYAGPHNSDGNPYYVGQPESAEYMTSASSSGFGSALLDGYANDMPRYVAWNRLINPATGAYYTAPPGPSWDMRTFDWDKDVQGLKESTCTQTFSFRDSITYNISKEMDAVTLSYPVKPNMGGFDAFKAKGGKIIHHHGWADSLVSASTSVSLYESVMQEMGIAETKSFWKLYMMPGVPHGTSGGVGWGIMGKPDSWDVAFGAMVQWVETGVEPTSLTGTRSANAYWGWPAGTRPLCPYPEVARYSGTGDVNDQANFSCVPPIDVRIEPETLNLKSKGEFTAFITVPEGYNMKDWNIGNLTCEGAPAVKGVLSGNTYIVKFDRQDLQTVKAGDAVLLTVKGTFTVKGKLAQIQSYDMVHVIK